MMNQRVVVWPQVCLHRSMMNRRRSKGHAWKMLGTVMDPSGHEYPYNASVDDYAVPKPPRRALLQSRGTVRKRTVHRMITLW